MGFTKVWSSRESRRMSTPSRAIRKATHCRPKLSAVFSPVTCIRVQGLLKPIFAYIGKMKFCHPYDPVINVTRRANVLQVTKKLLEFAFHGDMITIQPTHIMYKILALNTSSSIQYFTVCYNLRLNEIATLYYYGGFYTIMLYDIKKLLSTEQIFSKF